MIDLNTLAMDATEDFERANHIFYRLGPDRWLGSQAPDGRAHGVRQSPFASQRACPRSA